MPQEYLCTVKYACKSDDEQFIHAPSVAYARRIDWIYKVIREPEWHWESDSKEALLEILVENEEEDVWLWVDGDEAALPEPEPWHRDKFLYPPAAKALQMRQASKRLESREMAQMRQRVQLESPEVRLAAIVWLFLTSKAMKKMDSEYGLMDREEWDLSRLIHEWWYSLRGVRDRLPEAPTEEFEGAMRKEAHTCHIEVLAGDEDEVKRVRQWLYVQSVLFSERTGVPVNLMHRNWAGSEIKCDACRTYIDYSQRRQRQNIFYEPSPYSVLLAVVYYYATEVDEPSFLEWVAMLSSRHDYKKLIIAPGRQLCETLQSELKPQPEDWDPRYAPWINSYPDSWQYILSTYSSRTWKLADSILPDSRLSSEIETLPDFATWLAATTWTLLAHGQSLTVGERVACFNMHLKEIITDLPSTGVMSLQTLQTLHPPNTDTVHVFRDKVNNSPHTCWDEYDPGWYASAVSYLKEDDDPEFVPSSFAYSNDCKECCFVHHAHHFTKTLSSSLHPSDELSNSLVSMRDKFQRLGYRWPTGDNQDSGHVRSTENDDVRGDVRGNVQDDSSFHYDDNQDSDEVISMDNRDVQADLSVCPASAGPDTILQMSMLENAIPQSIVGGLYQATPYNVDSDHFSGQVFAHQPDLRQNTSIHQPLGFLDTLQSNSLSDPPALVPQQVPQSISSHGNFQTTQPSFPGVQSSFTEFSSYGNPPSYDYVSSSSTYDPSVSLELKAIESRQTSEAIPPGWLPQPCTKANSRLKKPAMIREVKKFIINELCGAGAKLGKFKDEYTLPWTQLEQNLKEWRIRMINWPEEVARDDSIKGIHGLNDKEVKLLWDAIHDKDPGKQLQFRRLESTGDAVEEGTSRKRRTDALDDQSRSSKSRRLNGQGLQMVWNLRDCSHNAG